MDLMIYNTAFGRPKLRLKHVYESPLEYPQNKYNMQIGITFG